jgi:hypothetical protein
MKAVQFVSCDDELIFAQFEFIGSLARHPIPLSTSLATEPPRPAASSLHREDSSAPSTVPLTALLLYRTAG